VMALLTTARFFKQGTRILTKLPKLTYCNFFYFLPRLLMGNTSLVPS
jgi:hypothetical protein